MNWGRRQSCTGGMMYTLVTYKIHDDEKTSTQESRTFLTDDLRGSVLELWDKYGDRFDGFTVMQRGVTMMNLDDRFSC